MSRADPALNPSIPRPVGRALELTVFAVLPLVLTVAGFWIGAIAWDFHHELYPQAALMLEGRSPYPEGEFEPLTGSNHVWPPAAAALVAPLTFLPSEAADLVWALLGLGCFALALWLARVRDWRVYGAAALWPPILIEPGLSHLTPFLALLAVLAWRARDSRYRSGTFIGLALALKLFMWPLVVWLAATRHLRAGVVAVIVSAVSFLALLPYTGLNDYARAVRRVSAAYDQDSYTVFGLIVQAGGSAAAGHLVTVVLVAALTWATWRYRSFTLAIATALAASPIVWLDYFALAAIPLALTRPRLSPVWLVPLATAGAEGAGWRIGDVVDIARVLGAFAIVLAVAFVAENARRQAASADACALPAAATAWPAGTRATAEKS